MFPFSFESPEEMMEWQKKQYEEQKRSMEISVDTFQNQLHEFFDSLDQEQLNFLDTLLKASLSHGESFLNHQIGMCNAYLRMKFNFCSQTGALAGEKLMLHGVAADPSGLIKDDVDFVSLAADDQDDTPESVDAESEEAGWPPPGLGDPFNNLDGQA